MRGAAVSDLHLGYRAYAATIDGRNAREVDVERAWERAIDSIVAAKPIDLVTIAGDVFHHPRVGVHAIKAFRDGLRRIVDRTGAEVVVLQGNHDAGRTVEIRSPIEIPDDLHRVRVMTEAGHHWLEAHSSHETVRVTGLPFEVRTPSRRMQFGRAPDADVEVLVVHAPVNTSAEGVERLPSFYAGEHALDVARLTEVFDVVHAGDYHDYRPLHPDRLAFYSGAIERTTSNVWQEHHAKGVVIYNTATGSLGHNRHEVRPVQDFRLIDFDLDPFAPNADEVNQCLTAIREADTEGSVVRLVVDGFGRAERERLDWGIVRELKQRCLHFQLDLREAIELEHFPAARDGEERPSLAVQAERFFADDPEPVRECALSYLGEREAA